MQTYKYFGKASQYVPELRVLFVHIPKAGGTTVERGLQAAQPAGRRRQFYGHTFLSSYQRELKDFDEYFSFTVVRNPFTRMVSAWNYMRKNAHQSGYKPYWEILERNGCGIGNSSDFTRFCCAVQTTFQREPERVKNLLFLQPQTRLLRLPGTEEGVDVDFVCKLETLTKDLRRMMVCAERSQSYPGLRQRLIRASGKHLNRSSHALPKTYYDAETIEIVRALYSDDFAAFGYDTSAPPGGNK